MVASKLKLGEMNTWIQHELHGYPSGEKVPDYRILNGDVRAHNPYNGYLMPFRFEDPKLQEHISRVEARQSIGSLCDVVEASSDYVQVAFSEEQMAALRATFEPHNRDWLMPFRKIATSQVTAIFDAVRNTLLDWTLRLESEGILGEGMTFTAQEKERAAGAATISIGSVHNFQGVIGTVSNSTLLIDNVAAVDDEMKRGGFSEEERIEIQSLIAQYKTALPKGKLALAKRGIQWVVGHADKLGSLAAIFRDFFGKQ
jgi:hypothetical protein